VAAGHEIGVHGDSHENPIAMTHEQESAVLDRCIELIEKRAGRRPTGYVAPWWEFSPVTNELLLERGITYDQTLVHRRLLGMKDVPLVIEALLPMRLVRQSVGGRQLKDVPELGIEAVLMHQRLHQPPQGLEAGAPDGQAT
jgi:peptidoglycan/xylan/chitin deacetylase (PgdA/CDA1 family)